MASWTLRLELQNRVATIHWKIIILKIQPSDGRSIVGPVSNRLQFLQQFQVYREHEHKLFQGCQTHFHRGHIRLADAFKGLNIILGLYNCNRSLTIKRELSASARQKQGARLHKTRWRAGFGPRALCGGGWRALCLPPVDYMVPLHPLPHYNPPHHTDSLIINTLHQCGTFVITAETG